MINAIKKRIDEHRDARVRESVARMNAENKAALEAKAEAERKRLAAVAASVRAGSAERTAPPPQTGMPRRPALMTLGQPAAPVAGQVSGANRARVINAQEEDITGVPRR